MSFAKEIEPIIVFWTDNRISGILFHGSCTINHTVNLYCQNISCISVSALILWCRLGES